MHSGEQITEVDSIMKLCFPFGDNYVKYYVPNLFIRKPTRPGESRFALCFFFIFVRLFVFVCFLSFYSV